MFYKRLHNSSYVMHSIKISITNQIRRLCVFAIPQCDMTVAVNDKLEVETIETSNRRLVLFKRVLYP